MFAVSLRAEEVGRTAGVIGRGTLIPGWLAIFSHASCTTRLLEPRCHRPLSPRHGRQPHDCQRAGRLEFFLTPDQFIEYKFSLNTGARMVFNLKATGPVEVDFHTVPDGKPISGSETFQRGQASSGSGDYRSPYPGLHGWYWHNRQKRGEARPQRVRVLDGSVNVQRKSRRRPDASAGPGAAAELTAGDQP